MNNIGEQHRHLLVLSRLGGLREPRTALAAELGLRARLRAAGPTKQPRRGPSTATIPAGVHASIVSPLFGDVRHIVGQPTGLPGAGAAVAGAAGAAVAGAGAAGAGGVGAGGAGAPRLPDSQRYRHLHAPSSQRLHPDVVMLGVIGTYLFSQKAFRESTNPLVT